MLFTQNNTSSIKGLQYKNIPKQEKKKERQPVVEIVEIHEDPIVECMKFAYHLEAIIPKKMEILYMGSQAYSVW